MVLDYIALGIMIFLILLVVWVVLKLGALPGRIAEKRGHSQYEAIRVAGWIGILTMGVFWPLALVWAYTVTADMKLAANEQIQTDEPDLDLDDSSSEESEAGEKTA